VPGLPPLSVSVDQSPAGAGEIDGVHAEGADSDPEKERQIPLLVGHVPADGHVSPMVTSRNDNSLDRPQDRRVVGDVEACDPLVRPVHRKDVLDEIIGPDGKKSASRAKASTSSTTAGSSTIMPISGCRCGAPFQPEGRRCNRGGSAVLPETHPARRSSGT